MSDEVQKLTETTFKKIRKSTYIDLFEDLGDNKKLIKRLKGYGIILTLFELTIFVTILVVSFSLWLTK